MMSYGTNAEGRGKESGVRRQVPVLIDDSTRFEQSKSDDGNVSFARTP
jgi:hypothetical protein